MRVFPMIVVSAAGLCVLGTSLPAHADWDDHGRWHRHHADRDDWRLRGDRDDWRWRGDRDDWRWRGDRDDWRRGEWQRWHGWNGGWGGYYGPYGFGFGAPGITVFVR